LKLVMMPNKRISTARAVGGAQSTCNFGVDDLTGVLGFGFWVFGFQVWIYRFCGLPPAGLPAVRSRSDRTVWQAKRGRGGLDEVESCPAGGNAGATPDPTAKSEPAPRP
jgi:hypothetical protein